MQLGHSPVNPVDPVGAALLAPAEARPHDVGHDARKEYNSRVDEADTRNIQASLAGDDDAFAQLVKRHQPRVGDLMWRFTRRHNEWAGLVQDVFVEAFLALRSYRAEGPFAHWLRKIAVRVGYRFWRERARQTPPLPLADLEHHPSSIGASEAAQLLHALLARLPADDRLVLTLQYFEECSMRDIADQTGWTEDAVKMRALRARQRLKAIAEREHLLEALGWTH
jgi:RNA polymerase sigma-70 factor (ECF subfamily)